MRIKDLRFGLHKFGGQMSSSSSKICMNGLCGTTTTPQWKRGWPMKAGGFATLCLSCGIAFDGGNYCERFHLNEPGWRECKFCEKPVHCGCVVSKYLHECLDLGGISCVNCLRATGSQSLKSLQSFSSDIPNGFASFSATWHPLIGNRMNGAASHDKGKIAQLSEALDKHQPSPQTSSMGHQIRQEDNRIPSGEFGMGFSSKDIGPVFPNQSSLFSKPDNTRAKLGLKPMYETLPQSSLGFSLGNALGSPNSSAHPIPGGIVEAREQEKVPPFKQGQRSRHVFPKPSKPGVNIRTTQPNKVVVPLNRIPRAPAEGRGRNQLLPRYWPKMTDQELEKISGDLKANSRIVPLFEKVLSASDAGRIGRLVLPKACAEAYFPTINQSEGLPIRIQDIKGKEWTFQFRFWPNNNSRMYVLEGVTPCIQNMQLQAGDTVIFSRLDPEEKLVIGCRKQAVSPDRQEAESVTPNVVSGGTSSSGVNENQPTKTVEHEGMANGDSVQRPSVSEKKKARNIGSKSKRLHMHSEDAVDLKMTWDETQELLRAPPTSKPTVVIIENWEFEEYDEPPVVGKKTIFTMLATGVQEQWGQCDCCSKWRKLPLDVLLPPKWTCSDNVWDPERCSCSAPDEMNSKDLDRNSFRFEKDSKKRKLAERRATEEQQQQQQQQEPSGLDALATAAVLGEVVGEYGETSTGPTTRHPRHRPGCSCIVCIQPPSGKGKHKPSCMCNVCMTVKRRFKTLMLRKKKRLSEREAADMTQKPLISPKDDLETGGIGVGVGLEMMGVDQLENGTSGRTGGEVEMVESSSKGSGAPQQLDLNCDPDKEDEMMIAEAENMDTTSLVKTSGVPVDWQSGLSRLVPCPRPKDSSEIEDGQPFPVKEQNRPGGGQTSTSTSPTPPPSNPASAEGCSTSTGEAAVELEMDGKVAKGGNL